MSAPSAIPALPPSSSAPIQERTPSPKIPLDGVDPKKAGKKKGVLKKKVATQTKPVKSVDGPASQRVRYRYEPYQKGDPTPETEGDLSADTEEELESLGAAAKLLYKSDREILDYVEALNRRTAALLENANRASSQLRSCRSFMERIKLFVDQQQKIEEKPTYQKLFGVSVDARREKGMVETLGSGNEGDVSCVKGSLCPQKYMILLPAGTTHRLHQFHTRTRFSSQPKNTYLSTFISNHRGVGLRIFKRGSGVQNAHNPPPITLRTVPGSARPKPLTATMTFSGPRHPQQDSPHFLPVTKMKILLSTPRM
jgi:hypothetical protein